MTLATRLITTFFFPRWMSAIQSLGFLGQRFEKVQIFLVNL
jgi:hypothetical protein